MHNTYLFSHYLYVPTYDQKTQNYT
jgi:hypothetical protein